ncbi:MAG: hypothetical protein RR957_07720 [Oscillospiraceae bacterium]
MITIKEINYKSYGKCLELSNGIIEVVATLDIGPRIIRFSKVGGENMFFEDLKDLGNQSKDAKAFEDKFGDEGVWHSYGGHRLWVAPEALPRSYYPENAPIKYENIENGVRLLPPLQTWTQNKLEMEVILNGDSIDLNHKVFNMGAWPQKFAPWCITVLDQHGFEVIPIPDRPTGLLHNRKMSFWDYTKMNDERVYWGDKYITLRQDPTVERAFKFGIDSQHGFAAYFNHGDMLVKYFDIIDGAEYPDDGMCFETYTNPLIMEMESIGEFKVVEPGDFGFHHEKIRIIPDVKCPNYNDEVEIDNLIKKHV